MSDPITRARIAIAAIHAQDPEQRDGRPAEQIYAEAVEAWVLRLTPTADPLLRLAAQAQHLQRWSLPRSDYPMDRVGYHRWRTEQYRRQGALAGRLCREAGLSEVDAAQVEALVAKQRLSQPDGQTLEDAACLVFLSSAISGFAAGHADYPPEKYLDILRRTLRKMSPVGRDTALALTLPEPFAGLVRSAAASLRNAPAG